MIVQLLLVVDDQYCVMLNRLPYDIALFRNLILEVARNDIARNDLIADTKTCPPLPHACLRARYRWGGATQIHMRANVHLNRVAWAFDNDRVMRTQIRNWQFDAGGQ